MGGWLTAPWRQSLAGRGVNGFTVLVVASVPTGDGLNMPGCGGRVGAWLLELETVKIALVLQALLGRYFFKTPQIYPFPKETSVEVGGEG